nr:hypothetical protein [Mesorhizobium loti]
MARVGRENGDWGNVRAPADADDVDHKISGESGDVETPHVMRLRGPPMDGRYGVDALQHCFELCGDRRIFDGARLKSQQRGDQGQIVLNAVIELQEQ